jgi:hypothetical protein
MATIDITCPHCQSMLKGPESFRGKRVKCKKCGEPFTIPSDDDVYEDFAVVDDDESAAPPPKPKPKPAVLKPVVAKKPVAAKPPALDAVEEAEDDEDEDEEESLKRRLAQKKKQGRPVIKSLAAVIMIRAGMVFTLSGMIGIILIIVMDDKPKPAAPGPGDNAANQQNKNFKFDERKPDRGPYEYTLSDKGFNEILEVKTGSKPIYTLRFSRHNYSFFGLEIVLEFSTTEIRNFFDGDYVRVTFEDGSYYSGRISNTLPVSGRMTVTVRGHMDTKLPHGKIKIDVLKDGNEVRGGYIQISNVLEADIPPAPPKDDPFERMKRKMDKDR